MKKHLLYLIIFGTISCQDKTGNKTAERAPVSADTVAVVTDTSPQQVNIIDSTFYNVDLKWADSLVKRYVNLSENPLIQHAVKDSAVEWTWDRIQHTDTATYVICNIGTHVEDEDHTNARFSSCQWLYIDTIGRQIYEYDLPNDELIKWDR